MHMRRGTLRSFDSTAYTAKIELPGSLGAWLEDVPVARNISSAEMTAGRSVAVLLFDPSNPADAVVTAVWV